MIDFRVQQVTLFFLQGVNFFVYKSVGHLVDAVWDPFTSKKGRPVHHVAILSLHTNRALVAWQPDWQGLDPPFCVEHGSTVFTFIFQPHSKYNTEPNWKYLSGNNCYMINFLIPFGDSERGEKFTKSR